MTALSRVSYQPFEPWVYRSDVLPAADPSSLEVEDWQFLWKSPSERLAQLREGGTTGALAARGLAASPDGGDAAASSGPIRKLAIIGTAGREDDEPRLNADPHIFEKMCAEARTLIEDLRSRGQPIDTLVSGGAAYGDHVAVHLYLAGVVPNLELHLPAEWNGRAFVSSSGSGRNNPGRTSNFYHEKFQRAQRVDSFGELQKAIAKGAVVRVGGGFFERNDAVAATSDACLAFTFGEGPVLKDSGTARTMGAYLAIGKGHAYHVDLNSMELHPDAQVANQSYIRVPPGATPVRASKTGISPRLGIDTLRHLPPAYMSLASWNQSVRNRDEVIWVPAVGDFAKLLRGESVPLPHELQTVPHEQLRIGVPSQEMPGPEGYAALRGSATQQIESMLRFAQLRGVGSETQIRVGRGPAVPLAEVSALMPRWRADLLRPAEAARPLAAVEFEPDGSVKMGRPLASRPGVLAIEGWPAVIESLQERSSAWKTALQALPANDLDTCIPGAIDLGGAQFGVRADAVTAEEIAGSAAHSIDFLRSIMQPAEPDAVRRNSVVHEAGPLEFDASRPVEEWDPRAFIWFLRQVSLTFPVSGIPRPDTVSDLVAKFIVAADDGRCFPASRLFHSLAGSKAGNANAADLAIARERFFAWLEVRLVRAVVDALHVREVPGDRAPLLALRSPMHIDRALVEPAAISSAPSPVVVTYHSWSEMEKQARTVERNVITAAWGSDDSRSTVSVSRVGIPVEFPTKAESLHTALVPTYPQTYTGIGVEGTKTDKASVEALVESLTGQSYQAVRTGKQEEKPVGHPIRDLALTAYVQRLVRLAGEESGRLLADVPELAGDKAALFERYIAHHQALASCGWAGNAPSPSLVVEVAGGALAPASALNSLHKYVRAPSRAPGEKMGPHPASVLRSYMEKAAAPEKANETSTPAPAPAPTPAADDPVVDFHDGAHDFLSNFFPAEVTFRGIHFPSAENAYQFAKIVDPTDSDIASYQRMTPGQSKAAGKRRKLLSPDWDKQKAGVMRLILRGKFSNPELRARLLATGNRPLIEGNSWGDRVWGVSPVPRTPAEIAAALASPSGNLLGRLLMELRAELSPSRPVVINLHEDTQALKREGVVYAGRNTPDAIFGNVFTHLPNLPDMIKCASPEESVSRFRSWLRGDTDTNFQQAHRERILQNLDRIREAKGVACFCHPGPCHATVLIEAAFDGLKQSAPAPVATRVARRVTGEVPSDVALEAFRTAAAVRFKAITGERASGRELLLPVDTGNPFVLNRTAFVYPTQADARAEVASWLAKMKPFLASVPESSADINPTVARMMLRRGDDRSAPPYLAELTSQLSKAVDTLTKALAAAEAPTALAALIPLEALYTANAKLRYFAGSGDNLSPILSPELLQPIADVIAVLPSRLSVNIPSDPNHDDFQRLVSAVVSWRTPAEVANGLKELYRVEVAPEAQQTLAAAFSRRAQAEQHEQLLGVVHRLVNRLDMCVGLLRHEYPMTEHLQAAVAALHPERFALMRAQLMTDPRGETFRTGLQAARQLSRTAEGLVTDPETTERLLRRAATLQTIAQQAVADLTAQTQLAVPLLAGASGPNRLVVGGFGGAYLRFVDAIGVQITGPNSQPIHLEFDRQGVLQDRAIERWASQPAVVVDNHGIRDQEDREQLAALPQVRYLPAGTSRVCHAVRPSDYERWLERITPTEAPSGRATPDHGDLLAGPSSHTPESPDLL